MVVAVSLIDNRVIYRPSKCSIYQDNYKLHSIDLLDSK